ncbi:flagellar hook protein flgE [Sulfurimonas gotlandica GD1]|uniref:Flagellar hook protein FlgE n=1 Tax=Sulfurimonas gotlandica (strain DSM 19862 / JCM 16533 / GD1) TaxID=929558 RepID=B6BH26_SULGG|nr:flagellar hook protein FlgE [Sulfurimonas gotlandica]EDZ63623.1 flagellar hook protein FlgE [Sulfurimonas gotlandica GD1]EHP29813.1 flagellar hook protein flgE [Sulfurimonas gotlandica GD1]
MLKSLFSGVSGLQSHQVAMDVESNNIANVNTTGFKYSRANFSDLLAQTKAIATAPQGALGGKNPVQVGLGSTISSMTRIFSQGSVQNSDKNTDVAIQGDGFYIVSPDGGNTYKYTRAGDFKFDAGGNFVDNNGFVTQGWLRDPISGKVDSTAPITDINIPPGLTTPASASQEVVLKANLNSGPNVESFSPAYEIKTGTTNVQPAAIDANGNAISAGNIGVMFNEVGEAFSLQQDQGVWVSFLSSSLTAGTVIANTAMDITFNIDPELGIAGNAVNITAAAGATVAETANNYVSAINAQTAITGITASVDASQVITLINNNGSSSASHNINLATVTSGSGLATGTSTTAHRYQYNTSSAASLAGGDKTFTSMADLRKWMEDEANNQGGATNGITIAVNDAGKFVIQNPNSGVDDYDMNLKVTAYTNKTSGSVVTSNTRFTRNMEAMNSVLPKASGGQAFSQSFNAATHSSSIDIFDSLGSKHTLRMEFRKTALDTSTGSSWAMLVSVPAPATIDTTAPLDEKTGSIRFNNDGSLATYNPPNISFSGNNGSAPDQQVSLSFGTANSFDGMTSFDSTSSTSGISQDGYTGGDLVGIRIDQSGTLVGSFSNGRSFGLAQIGMAKFTNNEGLSVEGGNIFIQTANSGDPIIGTAATAGRGFIQAAALEASNVDLSRALTQLIIIQRGFQANGKTITTSDQLLQTLIGLKN